jgi:DNA (cytosine-5)-methyltransferase 1
MIYGSICSGIEAATVAWHGLGWKPAFFSEIEPFPRAVLQHHYPTVPLHGDFTTIQAGDYAAIDLLVGGTPCQAFSVAGLRQGFSDDRGNLTLEFVRLAQRLRPRWVVWENVPGVLSIDDGRAFGSFLGGLADCGYGVAYRILDAQHFGVPQRRRRVFVAGHLGDWRPAAEVLFEPESLRRDLTPCRKAREDVARTFTARTRGGGGLGTDFDCDGGLTIKRWTANLASTLNANFGTKLGLENQHIDAGAPFFVTESSVAHTLRAQPQSSHDPSLETYITHPPAIAFDCKSSGQNGFGVGEIAPTLRSMGHKDSHANAGGHLAIAIQAGALRQNPTSGPDGVGVQEDIAYTLEARAEVQAVAFAQNQLGEVRVGDVFNTINTNSNASGRNAPLLQDRMQVRRLTPRECERLQGFPDDYSLIPWHGRPATACPDGPRYKALGNSMAVPVMRWIGERIDQVDRRLAGTVAA